MTTTETPLIEREHAEGVHERMGVKLRGCPGCHPGQQQPAVPPVQTGSPAPELARPKHEFHASRVFNEQDERLCICGLIRAAPEHHRRSSVGMDDLGTVIQRLRAKRGTPDWPAEVDELPPPDDGERWCETCAGTRWVRRERDLRQPGFGQAEACPDCYVDVTLRKRLEKLLGQLPEHFLDWTLETFPTWHPGHQAALATAWRYCADESNPWALFHGPTGRGKTGMAIGICKELIRCQRSATYVHTSELLRRIRDTYGNRDTMRENESTMLDAVYQADVLLLDGLDEVSEVTAWAASMLFEIVGGRHDRRRQTIITTNRSPADLRGMVAGDPLLSRIGELAKGYVLDFAKLPDLRQGRPPLRAVE